MGVSFHQTPDIFFQSLSKLPRNRRPNSALLVRAYNQRIKSILHPVIPGFLVIRSEPLMLFIMVSTHTYMYIYICIYIYIYIYISSLHTNRHCPVHLPSIFPVSQQGSKDRMMDGSEDKRIDRMFMHIVYGYIDIS